MSIYSTQESKNKKNGPSGAPGPASASPGLANGEPSEIVYIFVAVAGETIWRKIIFSKKVSQCRKIERGTLWEFSTSILSQNIKKIKGDPFGKKIRKTTLEGRKKEKGDPLV